LLSALNTRVLSIGPPFFAVNVMFESVIVSFLMASEKVTVAGLARSILELLLLGLRLMIRGAVVSFGSGFGVLPDEPQLIKNVKNSMSEVVYRDGFI
jgi:hypothetical protein